MFSGCTLHIGMEKTGTTTIQTMMADNRGRLLRNGFFYSWVMGSHNHTNLVVHARDDDTSDNQRKRALARSGETIATFRKTLEDRFAAEADKRSGKHLILSNEHLQSRLTNLAEKHRLQALLAPHVAAPIQVYMYLRRQDLAATSLYGTRLISGAKIGFGQVLPELPADEPLPYFYDYLRMWREWCTVFGRDNVHVRVFETANLLGGDVAVDFLEWLGLDAIDGWTFPERQNESISVAAQYLMTRMNVLNPAFNGTVPNPLRGGANVRIIRTGTGRGLKPARADAQAFYDHFRDDNARLFAEAGLAQPNFTETFDQFPQTVTRDSVAPQELADAAVALYQDVVAELIATRAELRALKKRIE